jgi:uncharacterized protein
LLGFLLPGFARKANRDLLRWTVILFAVPTALYVVVLAVWTFLGSGATPNQSDAGVPAGILGFFEAMGRGGVKDAFMGNLVFVAIRWADLIATVRFPKVLGMFVLGLWIVRTGLAQSPSDHRAKLVRWSMLGWAVGLPMNVIAVLSFHRWPYLPPSFGGFLGVVTQAIGVPMLALGYAATVALLVVDGRRLVNVFAPVGRMALTNYLMHSIICIVLSYGFGLALWWRIGAGAAMAIAATVIVLQIPLSAWWLSRYRYGPVEWIWRRLTYGQPLALRAPT